MRCDLSSLLANARRTRLHPAGYSAGLPRRVHSLRTFCLIAALAAIFTGAPSLAAEDESPIELQPYRVRIAAAFGDEARFTPAVRQRILTEIETAARDGAGATWELAVAEDHTLWPPSGAGLDRLDGTADNEPAADADMVFRLALETAGARWRVSGRQWDATTRRLSPTVTRETTDRRAVAETARQVLAALFRPVLMVEETDAGGETVALRQRAGALVAGDEMPALRGSLHAGDLLQVVLRYFDRDHRLRQVQPVAWTYLVVQSAERGRVTARVVSGLRSPLGIGRRRVDVAAVAVRPHFDGTRLQLVHQNAPEEPLAGRGVTVAARTLPDEAADDEPIRQLSDRRGMVRLAADPSRPLVWVTVEGADRWLARVPVAPGVEPQLRLELPDDTRRLAAAGDLAQLKARLVDTVARRATLLVRTRAAARAGDWPAATRYLKTLDALPTARTLHDELRALLAAAGAPAGSTPEADDIAALIDRHLSDEPLRALKDEVAELRRLATPDDPPRP